MKKHAAALLLLLLPGTYGCAMLGAWKSIPPPGGCDRCHTLPISNRWSFTYTAVQLDDPSGRPSFQRPESTAVFSDRPSSSLEVRKSQDEKCFDCHRSPSAAHRERGGHYHH